MADPTTDALIDAIKNHLQDNPCRDKYIIGKTSRDFPGYHDFLNNGLEAEVFYEAPIGAIDQRVADVSNYFKNDTNFSIQNDSRVKYRDAICLFIAWEKVATDINEL